jgi:recombination protein RecR
MIDVTHYSSGPLFAGMCPICVHFNMMVRFSVRSVVACLLRFPVTIAHLKYLPERNVVSSRSSSATAQPVIRLIEELGKLPGIGPKTASRLAFHLLRTSRDDAIALAEAILEVKERVRMCSNCFNITETDPCPICMDPTRESRICVVEEPLDIVAIERTHEYRGRYHVLHGAVSPVDGIGPDKLKIRELIQRVERESPDEVIVFTNVDLPGEATATYIHRLLAPTGVKVTRPASGLPVGGDMEYADDMTLSRALTGRHVL